MHSLVMSLFSINQSINQSNLLPPQRESTPNKGEQVRTATKTTIKKLATMLWYKKISKIKSDNIKMKSATAR